MLLSLAMAVWLFGVCAAGMSTESIAPSFRRAILVRHGAVDRARAEPALKPGAFYGGNVDVPLSKLGEAEALAAARLIATDYGAQVSQVWSSPMKRARFGARAVGTALAAAGETWTPPLPVEEFEAFREIDRGPIGTGWTDLTPEEIEARDGEGAIWRCANEQTLGAWRQRNGGEGFCDLRARVLAQRDALLVAVPLGGAGVIAAQLVREKWPLASRLAWPVDLLRRKALAEKGASG